MANYKKIQTKAGTNQFHYLNQEEKMLYRKSGQRKSTVYLLCIEKGCKARAKIENDVLSRTNGETHDHPDHNKQSSAELVYAELKHLATTSRRPIRELQGEKLRILSLEGSGAVSWDKVRGTLNRLRRSTMPACPNIDAFVELLESNEIVRAEYSKIRETEFYSGCVDGCVVFSNKELISAMPEAFDMFVDGTFSVTPFHAAQLLIVLAEINGIPRPIAYIIMPNRLKLTYVSLFEFLREAIFCFDGTERTPLTFMSDFERASRVAASTVWPGIELIGCNFHHCQALRRKASSLSELSSKIRGRTIHHDILKMFMRLSLLPLEHVNDGFHALKVFINESGVDADFQRFQLYFQRVWMKHYEPETWCVSARLRRTNCNLEGYNNFIKQKIQRNPNPWKFLNAIQDLAYDASSKHQSDKARKLRTVDRSRLTKPLAANLQLLQQQEISVIDFLKAMTAATPFAALPSRSLSGG